jgi:alkylhydroperoxidase/carboxymuconolactone decarboxylase family protein YurZ
MDERTKLLVSLGSAVAANCVPCFEHFLKKKEAAGLTPGEIQEVAEIADQIKNGARMTIRSSIREMIGQGSEPCKSESERSCCC